MSTTVFVHGQSWRASATNHRITPMPNKARRVHSPATRAQLPASLLFLPPVMFSVGARDAILRSCPSALPLKLAIGFSFEGDVLIYAPR
jgi:hypothetical protein